MEAGNTSAFTIGDESNARPSQLPQAQNSIPEVLEDGEVDEAPLSSEALTSGTERDHNVQV